MKNPVKCTVDVTKDWKEVPCIKQATQFLRAPNNSILAFCNEHAISKADLKVSHRKRALKVIEVEAIENFEPVSKGEYSVWKVMTS